MKKIFLLLAALIVAAACAAPPKPEVTTNRNSGVEPAPVAMTEADAIAKEKAIWETLKTKDYAAFEAMLDADQMEVLPEGVMDKAASISGVKQFEPAEVNFSDWKFLSIDADAFLLTYTVAVKGKYQGKDFPLESARASSAWVNRNGKWLAIYHQESPIRPPMQPTTSPTPGATASPSASPGASVGPPPTTGPDPVANEKMVWDLFKAKNYDAFAQLLAPNFIEVEAVGTFDRAGSIQGVKTFDASKAVLSDWKSVNFDEDAALVTYVVKNPVPGFAPEGERHTTIWVRRDGKWMGQFHQGGTPVRPAPPASPAASPAGSVK